MKFGIVTSYGSASDYVEMAREAEEEGWDGVFAWDDISVDRGDVFDPWVVLGGMAAVTEANHSRRDGLFTGAEPTVEGRQ